GQTAQQFVNTAQRLEPTITSVEMLRNMNATVGYCNAKVFLAQYCKSFIRTGETFKVGGFGFVSSLGSQFHTILIQLDL
ncbi:hypothetical protein Tco_0380446, partial [Tanacetum coccineum]